MVNLLPNKGRGRGLPKQNLNSSEMNFGQRSPLCILRGKGFFFNSIVAGRQNKHVINYFFKKICPHFFCVAEMNFLAKSKTSLDAMAFASCPISQWLVAL